MIKKYIVTTTISLPTEATIKFCNKKDWNIIIIGDKKTPHESYRELEKKYSNLLYISPAEQQKKFPKLSKAIGWNKIMRRNIGFVEAYNQGAEIIASVDDDNIPYDNWGKEIFVNQEIEVDCWVSTNGVFDPLSITNVSYLWHRGYPSELIPSRGQIENIGKIKRKVLIQADLWDGIPDIDAMNRIIFKPNVTLEVKDPFCSLNIAPFNSQNTFFSRDVIPYYMVLPYIGRFDDIWGAYLLQKKFPDNLIFNKATVYQNRMEPHYRNIKDLKEEMFGYENSLQYINNKYDLPAKTANAYNEYRKCFE